MKRSAMILLVLFLLLCSFLLSLDAGASSFGVWDALKGEESARLIILSLRLPRALGATLAGIGLALAGLFLQTATGNDLASPHIIGINTGSGFLVLLFLVFFPHLYSLLPAAAFLGAFLAVALVLFIRSHVRGEGKTSLILAGIAVNAIFNAGIQLLSSLYPEALVSYASFQSGGFSGVYLDKVLVPGILIALCFAFSFFFAKDLTKLTLGDELASSMGVDVKRLRIVSLVLASLLASASVSICGLLGFVGLVIPHLSRFLFGERVEDRILPSAMLGALLLLLSDVLGRVLFAPSELSAGVITAFIGVPFFVYLLIRRNHGRR